MKKIGDFEIVDHGILYFVDCQNDNFCHTATGIGCNMKEAIHDCVNQMWMADFDTEGMEKRILEQMGQDAFPTTPSIDKRQEKEKCEYYYQVSIQWNETHRLPTPIGDLCVVVLRL